MVIPAAIKRAAGIREGDKLLVLAVGDTIVLKPVVRQTFRASLRRVWAKVRELGLSEEDIDALIEEAKATSRP